MIDQFTISDFVAALPPDAEGLGLILGEHCWRVPIDGMSGIFIRSSIDETGVSRPTGEDSIRLWLVGVGTTPLMGKLQRWVTRQAHWRDRLVYQIEVLKRYRRVAGNCPECDEPRHINTVKKQGPNNGRLFAACYNRSHDSFKWMPSTLADSKDLHDEGDSSASGQQARGTDPFLAQHPGRCLKCSMAIKVGDPITKENKAWVHVTCPESPRTLRDIVMSGLEADERKREDKFVAPAPSMSLMEALGSSGALSTIDDNAPDADEIPFMPTAPVVVKREFIPSPYQLAVFDAVKARDHNLVVEAVAGSGKTETNVRSMALTHDDDSVAGVAFNKSVAEMFKSRVPPRVTTGTTHALGLRDIRAHWPDVRLDEGSPKDRSILKKMAESLPARAQYLQQNSGSILHLVSLLKGTLSEPNIASIEYLADRYGVDLAADYEKEVIVDAIGKVYNLSVKAALDDHHINFDDMNWLVATGHILPAKYDWVFGDEVQDWNRCQIAQVLAMVGTDGHIAGVGDRNQSIYGFRGADTEAVPNLIKATSATLLDLPITYRCPVSHVLMAREFVPQLQWREGAPDGLIENIYTGQLINKVHVGDLVLCRTNAPLVKPCLTLIAHGTRAVIAGRDIGTSIAELVGKVSKRSGYTDIPHLLGALEEYVENERENLLAAHKNNQASSLMDQFETAVALADGCTTLYELRGRIKQMFSDEGDNTSVRFSTVHRAKGGEADRVFILKPELMPHPLAVEPWEVKQERNIKYVALTRSRSELYFVEEY